MPDLFLEPRPGHHEAPVAGSLGVFELSVRYRRNAVLSGVNLTGIRPGEMVALTGPNGAGKSTLLKAMAGLVPAAGRVCHGDDDWLTWPARKRVKHIGFMPQSLPADNDLTVLEATLTALHGGTGTATRAEELDALRLLEHLGIGALALRPLFELSGGQRQLAALAQTVVRRCPVLLLDEPVSALDLAHQWQVMNTARRLADEGRIVIVVLHDLALAAQWADRVAILHDRRIHSFGPPRDVITDAALRDVWGVEARVRHCERGRAFVLIDDLAKEPDVLASQ